jgi:predicted RNase H-like HicB family nuclease
MQLRLRFSRLFKRSLAEPPTQFGKQPCLSQYNIPMRNYTLPIIIERDAEGFYVSCPPLQGCYSQGDTYDEALSNIKDAIRLHLEARQADHDELAEPKSFSLSTVEISV